ncbi:MAG: SIMPL domain-containing protein [Proteobacteria bacterium]|nr:SIMPL domain-containing protein [Pseudomonadota bacterium]
MKKSTASLTAALTTAVVGLTAHAAALAQSNPPPAGVVNLSASASLDVPQDWMTLTFTTTREGADAGAVQGQLKKAVDAALAEARRVAKPGEVEVRTGAFSVFPRYSNKGGITGWQGSTELVVEGRDMPAIAKLSGTIGSMTIARVHYGLSRQAREKVEADVAAQAIAKFRAQAEQQTKLFGYSSYTLREASVSSEGQQPPVMYGARAMTMEMAKSDGAPLPTEAGKSTVTATVSGSIQLLK